MVAAGLGALVLAAAGWWIYEREQDRPVRAAFETAHAEFEQSIQMLAEAESAESISEAGSSFESTLPTLEEAARAAEHRDSNIATAAARVVHAEIAVARSAASLTSLTNLNLTPWVEAHEDIAEGFDRLREEAEALDTLGASPWPPDDIVASVELVVAAEAVESVDTTLGWILDEMEEAKLTADLHQVADRATEHETLVSSVVETFEASADTEMLERHLAVYEALAGLREVDGESLRSWRALRAELKTAGARLGAESRVRGALHDAVEGADRLVRRATQKLRRWKQDYDAAVDSNRRDRAVFTSYRSEMRRQLDRYSDLRGDLSSWNDRVEDPSNFVTYEEAYSVLSEAQLQRQEVRDAMAAMTVPEAMSTLHNKVLAVIDDAVLAVSAAYDGAFDSEYCETSCYYKDTVGWQRFSAESARITQAYDEAVRSWESSLVPAEAAMQRPVLPEQPVV